MFDRLADLTGICSHVMTLLQGRATRAYKTEELLRTVGEAHHARAFLTTNAPSDKVIPLVRLAPGVVDARGTEGATVLFIDPGRFRPDEVRRILRESAVEVQSLTEAKVVVGDIVRTLSRREAA